MNTTAPPNPSPNLPPLTPEDRALLRAFLDAHEDFAALAQSSGRDLFDLYTWAASPAIAPWLSLHRTNQSHSDRAAALHTLRTTLRDSANPIEQRRAATALLRAHTLPLARGTAASSPRPALPARVPPSRSPVEAELAEALDEFSAVTAAQRRFNAIRAEAAAITSLRPIQPAPPAPAPLTPRHPQPAPVPPRSPAHPRAHSARALHAHAGGAPPTPPTPPTPPAHAAPPDPGRSRPHPSPAK